MRIAIIEDEAMAAEMLRDELRELLGTRISSVKIIGSLEAARCYIQEREIDLLFLDLDLRGDDGFDIFQEIASGSFQTVIVSGHTEKALKAFNYSVLDFIPKPFSRARLQEALKRYDDREKWKFRPLLLTVESDDGARLIQSDDIRRISRIEGRSYIRLESESAACNRNLQELEAELPPTMIRVHRSHIVNLKYISEILVKSGGYYACLLQNGEKIPIGRSYYAKLKKLWNSGTEASSR